MLGTTPPRPLVRYAKKRITSLVPTSASEPAEPAAEIRASIPLYRLRWNRGSDSAAKFSTVRSGFRLIMSLHSSLIVLDVIKVAERYSSGFYIGDAGQLWLDAISAVVKGRSMRSRVIQARILQIPAVHTEYLWQKCRDMDRFFLFDKWRGVVKGQRSRNVLNMSRSVRAQIQGRIKKRDNLNISSES